MAVLAFIGGTLFYLQYRSLDRDDDRLNMLPTGHIQAVPKDVEEPITEERDMGHEIKE
jgi:POT family proton-dependent oligopeptide transporter